MQKQNITLPLVMGIFDADGGFGEVMSIGSDYEIRWTIYFEFTQRDQTLLQRLVDFIVPAGITRPAIETNRSTPRVRFYFTPGDAGATLIKAWESTPPRAPSKLLDYRILLILGEATRTSAEYVIKKRLPGEVIPSKKVANLAILFLRYQMYYAQHWLESQNKKSQNKKKPDEEESAESSQFIPIEKRYASMKATTEEIEQSVRIGKSLFAPIAEEIAEHKATLPSTILPLDYVRGYHIGDGSFFVDLQFTPAKGSPAIKFTPVFNWSLTDCPYNAAVGKAMAATLKDATTREVTFRLDGSSYKLERRDHEFIVSLIELWKDETFVSDYRTTQYECFAKARKLYRRGGSLVNDLSGLLEFINVVCDMSVDTSKRKSSRESLLQKAKEVHNYKMNKKKV